MRVNFKKKPRKFTFRGVTIKDLGKIYLKNNEMVSFVNNSGKECDFAQKSWGFYTCPSVNGRLKTEGFKTALASNKDKRLYVLVVDKNKIPLEKGANIFLFPRNDASFSGMKRKLLKRLILNRTEPNFAAI